MLSLEKKRNYVTLSKINVRVDNVCELFRMKKKTIFFPSLLLFFHLSLVLFLCLFYLKKENLAKQKHKKIIIRISYT